MEVQNMSPKPKTRWGVIFASGCLFFLFLLLCLFATTFGFLYKEPIINLAKNVTPTPTSIPTPAPLVTPFEKSSQAFDNFNNFYNWDMYYANGKLEITNGKMLLQSYSNTGFAIAENNFVVNSDNPFYIQADLMTDTYTRASYGLVFGINDSTGQFYLFQVFPESQSAYLYKNTSGDWKKLAYTQSLAINNYPKINTLGVRFDKGKMDLYVNGVLVKNYIDDSPSLFKGVGVYVEKSGYRLIVDNFFTLIEKK